MPSRTCIIHSPNKISTYTPTPTTHFPMLHIAHSAWSKPPPLTKRANCDGLHGGAAWSQTRLPRVFFSSNHKASPVNVLKRTNKIKSCSALLANRRESSTTNRGGIRNQEEERMKRFLEGIIQGVRRIEDVPCVANHITDILESESCNRDLFAFVENTMLNNCRRLFREVICYCNTESSSRLQPTMALLGHLVKHKVIPAEPAFALAEALLREVDQPYRIEGVFTLLVDPTSGILTDKDRVSQVDRILREMRIRNLQYLRESNGL